MFGIFDENFDTICGLIEDKNYSGSSNIATDLITISVMSNFRDGLFIGEVFEGVFDQIGVTLENFKVPEEDQKALREKVREYVTLVSRTYKNKDKGAVYEALLNLRVTATEFQFKCYKTMKPKESGVRYALGKRRFG